MNLRRFGKALGWAVAYFVGDGLLFLACVLVLHVWSGLLTHPAVFWSIGLGTPLIFAFVAVLHGITGKFARTDLALRKTALFVLWPLAFYFGTIALLLLLASVLRPHGGEIPSILIFLPAIAGGVAGSLCWRGKLPGTRLATPLDASPPPSEPAGPRDEEEED